MAEILDDYEQGERVKKWLQNYAPSILLGLGVAAAGLFGASYWGNYKSEQKIIAAANYALLDEQLTELTAADNNTPLVDDGVATGNSTENARLAIEQAYQTLTSDHNDNLYTGLAGLLLADTDVKNNDLDAAVTKYQQVINGKNSAIADLARLRLARTQIAANKPDDALNTLNQVAAPEYYLTLNARTRGDAYMSKGDNTAALEAYTEAEEELGGTPDPLLTYQLAQLRELDVEAILASLKNTPPPIPSFNNVPLNTDSSNIKVTPTPSPSSVDIQIEENNGVE